MDTGCGAAGTAGSGLLATCGVRHGSNGATAPATSGWAPMPPDPYWQAGYYYGSYDCASPGYYSRAVFVSEANFASPRISTQIVVPSQNAIVARGAVNVTSYSRVGSAINNSSIDLIKLQAATGQIIKPVRVVQARDPIMPGSLPRTLHELRIYRPVVATGSGITRRPNAAVGGINDPITIVTRQTQHWRDIPSFTARNRWPFPRWWRAWWSRGKVGQIEPRTTGAAAIRELLRTHFA
jgi:hypothetical protein